MKGLFFKNKTGEGYEIISDAMPLRHEDGYDEFSVVVKKLSSNKIDVIQVYKIDSVVKEKAQIGY